MKNSRAEFAAANHPQIWLFGVRRKGSHLPMRGVLFVQLADYNRTGNTGWPAVREAQRQALSLRNTGMLVTIDIGNPNDIHPTNKQDVGLRGALAARAVACGDKLEYSGSVMRTTATDSGGIRVWLDHADGLATRHNAPLTTYEVPGKDGSSNPRKPGLTARRFSSRVRKSMIQWQFAMHGRRSGGHPG